MMRKRNWISGGLLLWMVSAHAISAEGPRFDGRAWTVGNHQENGREILIEYVLPGQTVDDWKELVTSTIFRQPVPLAAFVERIHASMSEGCPSLVWNVIRQDEKTAVFEWRDAGCGGFEPQNELDRVTIQKDGIYRLAYAAKVRGLSRPRGESSGWTSSREFRSQKLGRGSHPRPADPLNRAANPARRPKR